MRVCNLISNDGHYAELHKNQFKDDPSELKKTLPIEYLEEDLNDLSSVSFIEQSCIKEIMAMATLASIINN